MGNRTPTLRRVGIIPSHRLPGLSGISKGAFVGRTSPLPGSLLPSLARPILLQRGWLSSFTCHSNLSFLACTPPRCARFARVNHPCFFCVEHKNNKSRNPSYERFRPFLQPFGLSSADYVLNETDSFFSDFENIDFFSSCQAVDPDNGQGSWLCQVNKKLTPIMAIFYSLSDIRLCQSGCHNFTPALECINKSPLSRARIQTFEPLENGCL